MTALTTIESIRAKLFTLQNEVRTSTGKGIVTALIHEMNFLESQVQKLAIVEEKPVISAKSKKKLELID